MYLYTKYESPRLSGSRDIGGRVLFSVVNVLSVGEPAFDLMAFDLSAFDLLAFRSFGVRSFGVSIFWLFDLLAFDLSAFDLLVVDLLAFDQSSATLQKALKNNQVIKYFIFALKIVGIKFQHFIDYRLSYS